MIDAQMKLIMDLFAYQSVWTKEDIETTHVPGVVFHTNTDVERALNRLITFGHLEHDGHGNYRRAE